MKGNVAEGKSLDRWKKKFTNCSNGLGLLYCWSFVLRASIHLVLGDGVYREEWKEFRCTSNEWGCESMCFDEYANPSMYRFSAYQMLAVLAPMVVFYTYWMQQRVKKEEEAIQKINGVEADSKRGHEEPDDDCTELVEETEAEEICTEFVAPVRTKKMKYHGNNKHVSKSNKWVRIMYFAHLVVRLWIEIYFVIYKINLFQLQGNSEFSGPYKHGGNHYFNMDVPFVYNCGQDPRRRTVGVEKARKLDKNGFPRCFVDYHTEKSYYMVVMNAMDVSCILFIFVNILVCLLRGVLKFFKSCVIC